MQGEKKPLDSFYRIRQFEKQADFPALLVRLDLPKCSIAPNNPSQLPPQC
jgi:hypothetical protein